MAYLFWIYCMMVIFRDVQAAHSLNLNPFWSYRSIKAGDPLLLVQDIMNVVAFIPVGLLLGFVFDKIKWWQVLLAGMLISFGIESLKFLLKRGFAEFDDVLHNSLGCLVGFGVFVGGATPRTQRCSRNDCRSDSMRSRIVEIPKVLSRCSLLRIPG